MLARNSIPGKNTPPQKLPEDKTCPHCGRSFQIEKIYEDGTTHCPKCGGKLRNNRGSKKKKN